MKTRWTKSEMEAIVARAAAWIKVNPDGTVAEALIKAQRLVEPNFRITDVSLRSYTKHSAELRAAVQANGMMYPPNRRTLNKAASSPTPAAVTPPPAPAPAPAPVRGIADATEAELIGALLALQRKTVLHAVEAALAVRFAAVFDTETGHTKEADPTAASPLASQAPDQAPDQVRVLVVGLLPVQAVIAEQRLGKICTLRFWTDNGTDKLRAGVKWADRVVTMTKFISHSTEDVIKRMGTQIVRCNGGVTDLVAQITHLSKEPL